MGLAGAGRMSCDSCRHAQESQRPIGRHLRLAAIVHRGPPTPREARNEIEIVRDIPLILAIPDRGDESRGVERGIEALELRQIRQPKGRNSPSRTCPLGKRCANALAEKSTGSFRVRAARTSSPPVRGSPMRTMGPAACRNDRERMSVREGVAVSRPRCSGR